MINLLYKEFKLNINYFFVIIIPLSCGALFLIPQWVFLVAFMYFFFISVPNICNTCNAHNDIGFTAIMPVCKSDIVKSKVFSFILIEIIHLLFGVVFGFINLKLYKTENFLLNIDFPLFGFALMMYGIFNLCFFPGYFKSAYFYGKPLIFAIIVSVLFATVVELFAIFVPLIHILFEGKESSQKLFQFVFFIISIIVFILLNIVTVKISNKRFESIDL
ncbi:MAG: ABC-2 transporter permease [Spirochaetales bacterium]|nr:ABC-2 transporter permease [Spirochaetales bacterium]